MAVTATALRAFFAGLLFFIPFAAFAAFVPIYTAGFQLGMMPQYPSPGQPVTLTISNSTGNSDTATYVWSVDGKTVLQGVGQKTLSVVSPNTGESMEVTVTALVNDIPTASVSRTIRPGEVDMVWEGKTATPPLYIGRPLPNGGSAIVVLAVPHLYLNGKEIPPSALIYTWKEDDTPLAGASGHGRSAAVVTPPRFDQAFGVSVHVENANGSAAADGNVLITPQTPKIAVYENAPLLGIRFEKNISGFFPFSGDEAAFTAFPLFVGNPDTLLYSWTLDGQAFQVDKARPRDVTFRKVGNGSGEHAVTFSFQSAVSFLEKAAASFKLTF